MDQQTNQTEQQSTNQTEQQTELEDLMTLKLQHHS